MRPRSDGSVVINVSCYIDVVGPWVFDKAIGRCYRARGCNQPAHPLALANMVPRAFEAGYAHTTGFRKVVKATIYIKKKDGMSDADFIDYYNNNHAQRAVPILQRHGIISYSLVKCPACHVVVRRFTIPCRG